MIAALHQGEAVPPVEPHRAVRLPPERGNFGAPSSVTAQPGDASATVSWSGASDNGSAITAYTVTASPGGRTVRVAGDTSATVTGLTNGVSYSFTVTATNGVGTGPASAGSAAITPAPPRLPLGWFDSARVGAGGALSVSGWTFDPDTPTAASRVDAYVDGRFGQSITANGSRPDIGNAFPAAGSNHGFTATTQVAPGTHSVCLYAIDTYFPNLHTDLGCRSVG
jgi:hypothetical protein